MSKLYLTSFVGTNIVVNDGRYLIVLVVVGPTHTAHSSEHHCGMYQHHIIHVYTANPQDRVVQGQRASDIHLELNIWQTSTLHRHSVCIQFRSRQIGSTSSGLQHSHTMTRTHTSVHNHTQ